MSWKVLMNLKWDDLKLFLAVHEQGSFSAAARHLRLGQPTLSRRIAELEEVVGEPLFDRKSLGTSLTAAGERILPAAQSMAEWAHEAELSIKKPSHLPEGKVRIAASPGIAYGLVAPLTAAFRAQHPQIQIEVLSGIEVLNLSRGEADISLRLFKPTDADLLCMDEFLSPMRVYVSRSYAAKLGPAPRLDELDWVGWAGHYEGMFADAQLRALIPDFKPVFTSDDYVVQIAACKAGAGAMILPRALCQHAGAGELQSLQELDIDLGPDAIGSLYLVCHKRRRHLPKVQVVMDFISKEFAATRAMA